MANTFLRKISRNIGNVAVTVGDYTVTSNLGAVVVGLSISNTTGDEIGADVIITNGVFNYYVLKDAPIPNGSTLIAAGKDQKIILQSGDSVKVRSTADSSIDVVMSVLETASAGFTDDTFTFNKTISANTENYDLKEDAMASGWDGTSILLANVTINSNVYVWSSDTSVPGFDATGIPSESTINIVNDGYIIGKGGIGSGRRANNLIYPAGAGGNAISISSNVNITNNGYIAGGGGGGGRGVSGNATGGGGAGGGESSDETAGGAVGQIGNSPITGNAAGASGGRILPGVGGLSVTASRTVSGSDSRSGLPGGSGSSGGAEVAASAAQSGRHSYVRSGGGGGGGWGASGGGGNFAFFSNIPTTTITASSGAGGSANSSGSFGEPGGGVETGAQGGRAVALNGYSVTWAATGTRYGAIS